MSVASCGPKTPPIRDEFCFHKVRAVMVRNRMWTGVAIVVH